MRRGRIFLFLILIVVVFLALLYLAYTQFVAGGVTPTTVAPQTQVYYAAQNIPQGTTITQEMLDTFSLPPENVAAVMFTVGEENALVGQVARFDLDQGVIITSSMVGTAPEIAGPPWAINIPSGMVAAAIPTNRLSLMGYGVADGARVNVNACMLFVDVDPAFQTVLPNFTSLVTGTGFIENQLPALSAVAVVPVEDGTHPSRQGRIELESTLQQPLYVVPGEAQRPRLVCQMILQDVLVLKVGNFASQTTTPTDPNATPSPVQAQQQANPDLVTLVVNPQDSISLNYFVYSGAMLSLSLRRTDDTSRFNAESATLTSLLTQYNISLPSKLPYSTQPRLDVLTPPVLPNDAVTVQSEQQ